MKYLVVLFVLIVGCSSGTTYSTYYGCGSSCSQDSGVVDGGLADGSDAAK